VNIILILVGIALIVVIAGGGFIIGRINGQSSGYPNGWAAAQNEYELKMQRLNRYGQWIKAFVTGIDPLTSTEPGTIFYKITAQWNDPNNAYVMYPFESTFLVDVDSTRVNQALSQPLSMVQVLFAYNEPTNYWMVCPW
jgi:hypothetical protein